ncbi:MAG TPA: AraC family transcriptional regulator [Microscillaceae bacterium]|nr:AraC family transcriptional regulator [Microscillaceae bacterium]
MNDIFQIKNISQLHQIIGWPPPSHPLISFLDDTKRPQDLVIEEKYFNFRYTSEMYTIMYKDSINGTLSYGRNSYDFQEGTLVFMSPGQVFEAPSQEYIEELKNSKGWSLIFHPDLIRKSPLGESIDHYSFFSYEVNEALHLSEKEQKFIFEVVLQIHEEYSQNIDKHSQRLIISNLELLLNYCTRFYDRQFYTRTNFNKDIVSRFETKLKEYFNENKSINLGIPSSSYFGKEMNMSSNYLSDLLKKETGKGIKEHINDMIVDKAKTVLLNSTLSISEIAFDLGFEYPQSFTRLFKNKTGVSPVEYRKLN